MNDGTIKKISGPLVVASGMKNANMFAKIVLLSILLIIVNKEPHQTIISTWILIFYLMKGIGEKEEKIENT